VFPLGTPPQNDDRKWKFLPEDFKRVAAEFALRTEPLPFFVEHKEDPNWGSKAAAWADSVSVGSDGLAVEARYTDQARDEIRAGHWGFVSPGFDGEEDAEGFIHPIRLSEVSLVNQPAIGGLPPLVASSQPTPPLAPPEKEIQMANEQTAAKKTAASTWDKAGLIAAIKAAFPGMFGPDFPDDQIVTLSAQLLEDGEADDPAKDPTMPGASSKSETPAVPAFMAAEDEATVAASATAPAKTDHIDEVKAAREKIASLEASVKALEARELSGKIVKGSGSDRTANAVATGTQDTTEIPDPSDHVGRFLTAYDQKNAPIHQAAIAYREKARVQGTNLSYREAVSAVSRRKNG
jgi:hypothetical protein